MKTKSFFAVLFGILTISVLVFHACKKEQKDPSPPTYTDGQGEIGQLGGTITIDDASSPLNGVTIIVPEDALQVNTLIQIVSAPDTVSFPGGSTQPIVQLLPDGLSFQEPITITMPFVSSNPNNIGLYYYDPSEELIEELEDVTINVQEGLISGLTNHFSYYTAADKEVKATINMFRTQEGVIGVRLDIYGTNNVELGLKWIPTTWWHKVQTLDQELNIWQVLTNPGGPHDGNVYSIFDVYLREGELIGSDPVSASHFSIIREENDPFKVKIIQRFPTNELYSSGFLHTEDIESNMSEMDYKNLGNWINGEPLIFLFDGFVPNPDKKYFVKMEWVLASELNASPLFNYSPIYKLHNKPDKRKLNQMSLTSMDQIDVDNNYIIDEFQVWGLNTAPVCNFTVDKPNASVGELIQFNDFSEYTPTSWQWDFGDGITSAQKDPTHSYSSPGTYTVSLEVTNAYGSDNETMDINVTEATFIAIVTPNGDEEWMIGSEQTISWDDNIDQDVKITLLQNNLPTLTIAESTASNGNFVWTIPNTVQAGTDYKIHIASTTNMSVYDNSNDFFTILEQGNIIVTKPNAGTIWTMGQYNVPIEWETGNLGGTVTIQVYKGDNKLGTPTPDAPNNGSYTGYNVQTTLAEGNDYRIKIISNVNPVKFDFSEYFEITESDNLPPEPPYDPYPEEGAVLEELTANLFWNCEDPEGDPLTYDVYVGENNPNPTQLLADDLETNTAPYENLNPGTTYYWKVVAKDDHENETASAVWWFEIESANPPVADFEADITSGYAPLIVNFNDLTINEPTSWLWDFGDGETSTEQNPLHIYNQGGSYNVSLTVSNEMGTDSKIKEGYILISTFCPESITDVEGNVYSTVLINNQCWMAENLKTSTFDNGEAIPNVTSSSSWLNLTSPAFCWHNNDESWKDTYGTLYNWFAVGSSNGLCPDGWHVPSNGEWSQLANFIGGVVAPNGNKLKSCRQVDSPLGGNCDTEDHPRWDANEINYGTDDYGLMGLPGGSRSSNDGLFSSLGIIGIWWSSTTIAGANALPRWISYNTGNIQGGNSGDYRNKRAGLSVRCLKN